MNAGIASVIYSSLAHRSNSTLGDLAGLKSAARQCFIDVPPGLHRARADAELARKLVLHMASRAPDKTKDGVEK